MSRGHGPFGILGSSGLFPGLRAAIAQLSELEQAQARFRVVYLDPVMVERCMTALRAELLLSTTLPTPNLTIGEAFDKVWQRVLMGHDPERVPAGELTDAEKETVVAYIMGRAKPFRLY